MRPALQRLLARPSSLDLLRLLVVEPPTSAGQIRKKLFKSSRHEQRRFVATARAISSSTECTVDDEEAALKSLLDASTSPSHLRPKQKPHQHGVESTWPRDSSSPDRLQLHASLSPPPPDTRILLDHPHVPHHMKLWLLFLRDKLNRDGIDGVKAVWYEMRLQGVQLPVHGTLADQFWAPMIEAGFKDQTMLKEICKYANELYDTSGCRWPKLYTFVIQKFLLEGPHAEAVAWHDRLFTRHPPGSAAFLRLLRNVILGGNPSSLKEIYRRNAYRNAYAKVVPPMLKRQHFKDASEWHFFLLLHGDKPSKAKVVEPLVQHLAIYEPLMAKKVTRSLLSSGVPFGTNISQDLHNTSLISREMMNLLHGETFHIGVKQYNDRLGARWFATTWVSLDIAMSTVHALGFQEIGPLSLQSIALREADSAGVAQRVKQLENLGISIGNSTFSKAVLVFARNRQDDYLRGLLESDQHPDALEDFKLQEDLMDLYAQAGEWGHYNRTMAIRLLRSSHPDIDRYNIILRGHAARGLQPAILRTLEEMRMKGIAVQVATIQRILHKVLRPRSPGRRVSTELGYGKDLDLAISILKGMIACNNAVPVTAWRELIRRLGLLGRLDDVDNLCLWLAEWYHPGSKLHSKELSLGGGGLRLPPAEVPTYHEFHPLRILFSNSLQRAIVEWGFVHAIFHCQRSQVSSLNKNVVLEGYDEAIAYRANRGIRLLRQLQNQGVYIHDTTIKRAIYTRLEILYGPGRSGKRYNRAARSANRSTLHDMVAQIDQAWGGKVFPDTEQIELKIQASHTRDLVRRRSTSPKLMAPNI